MRWHINVKSQTNLLKKKFKNRERDGTVHLFHISADFVMSYWIIPF